MKKICLLFISFLTSCITPPSGVCAYVEGEKGEIQILSIIENKEIDLKCDRKTTVKFKFFQNGITNDKLYSQDYPGYFIKDRNISVKKYQAIKMKTISNNCKNPNELFSFAEYKESFGYMCR